MRMLPKCAPAPRRTSVLLAVAMTLAATGLTQAAGVLTGPYPEFSTELDERHLDGLVRVIRDSEVTEDELREAAEYLQSVLDWAAQATAEDAANEPEAERLVAQARSYNAAVQQAYARGETSRAAREHDPRRIGPLLRRGFDDMIVGGALDWIRSELNGLIETMDAGDREAVAQVLSRVPPNSYLSAASIALLRATLPGGSSEAASFAERYPE